SAPWRSSITWASRPITTRPCIEFGSHGPFETGLGMKASPRLAKKGGFIMAGDHGGISAPKSRVCRAIHPFRANGRVGLGDPGALRQCGEFVGCCQLRERPDRSTAHQRTCVVKQALGRLYQRRIVGVADRDQHIANETV